MRYPIVLLLAVAASATPLSAQTTARTAAQSQFKGVFEPVSYTEDIDLHSVFFANGDVVADRGVARLHLTTRFQNQPANASDRCVARAISSCCVDESPTDCDFVRLRRPGSRPAQSRRASVFDGARATKAPPAFVRLSRALDGSGNGAVIERPVAQLPASISPPTVRRSGGGQPTSVSVAATNYHREGLATENRSWCGA